MVNFETATGLYLKILYDPYKKVFYRLVKHPQPLKNAKGQLNTRWGGPWSILILSQQLEGIAEYQISGQLFNPLISFVGPKGLYLLDTQQTSEETTEYEILDFKI